MSITDEAQAIVNGERRQDYGDMAESFERIAGFWSAYLGKHVDSLDVAKMMILLKVSRLKHNPLHYDSLRDIIGYAICCDNLINEQKMEK